MKPWAGFCLASALVSLVLLPGCAVPQTTPRSPEPVKATESSPPPAPEPLLGYRLPIDVAALEADLGKQDSTERPTEDDPSPWGQWLEWDRPDGSKFRALVDDYSSTTTDKRASIRYIELRAAPLPDSGDVVHTQTIQGFVLNESDIYAVHAALPGDGPSMMHERDELDPADLYHNTIVYEKDGLYTYCFFGDSGMLVGVGQATFSMDGAD